MYKRIAVFILLFALSSVAGLKSIAASPDCDKWLKQYQEELANAAPVKRVLHHVHHLAQRTHPRKTVQVAAIPPVHKPIVPKLTPAESLKRFHVLCDVPEEQADIVPATTETLLPAPPLVPPPTEIATAVIPPVPGQPISPNIPVSSVTPILPPPPEGAPGLPLVPVVPGSPSSPDVPTGPGTPVIPPVPEPGSIVLMLTGVAGIGSRMLRRK